MTGLLFGGGMRRVTGGRLGHLWRDAHKLHGTHLAAPLCGEVGRYPMDDLYLGADGITRGCPKCIRVLARLERLDRETGQAPCRPGCDLCGRPLKGWATCSPDDPAADCGGTCRACMDEAEVAE